VANVKSYTDTHDQSTRPIGQNTKRSTDKEWIPVSGSSSFHPIGRTPKYFDKTFDLCRFYRFIALWSRVIACGKYNHVLLDEEIQAGWDDDSSDGILNESHFTSSSQPRAKHTKVIISGARMLLEKYRIVPDETGYVVSVLGLFHRR
jgi:hypothetical protein